MTAQQTRARLQFLTWVKETFPNLYSAAMAEVEQSDEAQQLVGLGQVMGPTAPSTGESWWQKAAGAFTALGTTYLGLKNQRDIMAINLERAKLGQAPISGEDLTAPVMQTRIELPQDVIDSLVGGAGGQINKILLWGGAALLAFMLLR